MILPDRLTVDYEPVVITPGTSRHEAEREAVMRLLAKRFGSGTELLHDADGAPAVSGSSYRISISHCAGMAAIATHPTLRIGIDIETARPQLMRVRHKFLTEQEVDRYRSIDELLWAWTAKEAVYKAAGIAGLPLHAIQLGSPSDASVTAPDGTIRTFRLYSSADGPVTTTVAVPT